MVTKKSLKLLLSITCAMSFASAAQAWDPFAGADDGSSDPAAVQPTPKPHNTHVHREAPTTHPFDSTNQPHYTVSPAMHFAAPTPQPVTAQAYTPPPVYVQPPTYTPPPAAPQPVASYQPTAGGAPMTTTYAAPTAAYAPQPANSFVVPPAPTYAAAEPAAMPYQVYQPPQSYNTHSDHFRVGVDAFYDHYEEPDTFPDLKVNTIYGSIDGAWEHYYSSSWYSGLEGRVSFGKSHYKSNSGEIDNSPDWELDGRMLAGWQVPGRGNTLKIYSGLGTRYFLDYFKDDAIPGTYDRRIFQLYMPIGATYVYKANNGWTFTPNLELDPLLYGHVESRTNLILGDTAESRQTLFSGIGVRGELMMGKISPEGRGWQFGPFFRYWDVDDSDPDFTTGTLEPRNTRWQAGAKVEYLF